MKTGVFFVALAALGLVFTGLSLTMFVAMASDKNAAGDVLMETGARRIWKVAPPLLTFIGCFYLFPEAHGGIEEAAASALVVLICAWGTVRTYCPWRKREAA